MCYSCFLEKLLVGIIAEGTVICIIYCIYRTVKKAHGSRTFLEAGRTALTADPSDGMVSAFMRLYPGKVSLVKGCRHGAVHLTTEHMCKRLPIIIFSVFAEISRKSAGVGAVPLREEGYALPAASRTRGPRPPRGHRRGRGVR